MSITAERADTYLHTLRQIERKLLWLSAWTIHNANHLRPSRDGLKVGGHQASCASVISIMTALYFAQLRPQDRVAVKPHASPVFHAANYLFGRQSIDKMENLRRFGGAQAYPSRVKDGAEVDFSTGSVGLGVAATSFAALIADYVRLHELLPEGVIPGRHIAIAGDAELDEGNIYEALLEGWKHDIRNVWWIVDYNRQSLDSRGAGPAVRPFRGPVRRHGLERGAPLSTAGCRKPRSQSQAARPCAPGSTTARTASTPRSPSRVARPGAPRCWPISAAARPCAP